MEGWGHLVSGLQSALSSCSHIRVYSPYPIAHTGAIWCTGSHCRSDGTRAGAVWLYGTCTAAATNAWKFELE